MKCVLVVDLNPPPSDHSLDELAKVLQRVARQLEITKRKTGQTTIPIYNPEQEEIGQLSILGH